jgi:O-methyltransferase
MPNPDFLFCLDELNADNVIGWAAPSQDIDRIVVLIDGREIGEARLGFQRPDVVAALPHLQTQSVAQSGFVFRVPTLQHPLQIAALEVLCKFRDGTAKLLGSTRVPTGQVVLGKGTTLSPFPKFAQQVLDSIRGGDYWQPWTDEKMREGADLLLTVLERGSRNLRGLIRYGSYLNEVYSRQSFIERHFPRNASVEPSAMDNVGVTTTFEELMTLAHHLFVLDSYGVPGTFCEFGCFKGFSTSMLSIACARLGRPMAVFDSFEGLPPSDSTFYRKGDFAGSLAEVKGNVADYGNESCVSFCPGFFSSSVPASSIRPMCIWMDVDLNSSSSDVMQMLPRLPIQSCVFSHEVLPRHFFNEMVVPGNGPEDVIAPICAAFSKEGRKVTGRFLSGFVGAFWDADHGYPVLPTDLVLRLSRQLADSHPAGRP